jgi:protein subunit release factor A
MSAIDMLDGDDILVEIWPPRKQGGQQVGSGSNGIKITHLRYGLEAISTEHRTQHKNRAIAAEMIVAAITSGLFPAVAPRDVPAPPAVAREEER